MITKYYMQNERLISESLTESSTIRTSSAIPPSKVLIPSSELSLASNSSSTSESSSPSFALMESTSSFQTPQKSLDIISEWIDVHSPIQTEITELIKNFDLPSYIFEDISDIDERARVDQDEAWMVFILRAPVHEAQNAVPYTTFPIGILYSSTYIFTIAFKENDLLADFILGKVKNFQPHKHTQFLLQIVFRATKIYLKYLKDIQRQTTQIEEELQISLENSDLHRLLDLKKSLVFFTTSLKSNEAILDRLQKPKSGLTENEMDLLEEIIIEHKQAIDMANIYTNIITGMLETFASIISNNLNIVMKILTVVTIILTIPTLIASLFGMNVALPFQNSGWAFGEILAVAIGVAGVALWFLKRKKLY